MSQKTSFPDREERILDAAESLFVRLGYDKTTMNDIAGEAGVTRAIAYLHFKGKDALFEALLLRSIRSYLRAWLDDYEAGLDGGALSGVFRSALTAVNRSPFLSALMRQDQRVFGSYLRKSGSIFETLRMGPVWVEALRTLQQAGAVRPDVDPEMFSYLLNALSVGLVTVQGDQRFGATPPFEDLMGGVADLLDRALLPAGGGDQRAGRDILKHMAMAAAALFENSETRKQ